MVLSRYSRKKANPMPRVKPTIRASKIFWTFFGLTGRSGTRAGSTTAILVMFNPSVIVASLARLSKDSNKARVVSASRFSTSYLICFWLRARASFFFVSMAARMAFSLSEANRDSVSMLWAIFLTSWAIFPLTPCISDESLTIVGCSGPYFWESLAYSPERAI